MSALNNISDDVLEESYYKAIELNLSSDFVEILIEEITMRDLQQKI